MTPCWASLAFFNTETRKGSSWEFLRQLGRMYDQDGKPSATTQWTMEVFRGTAEWEYGRYVGAAAQRTAISTARWPDRSGSGQRQLEVLRPVQGSASVSEPDRLGRWFRFVAFWVLLRRLARLAKRHNNRYETKPKPFRVRSPAAARAPSRARRSGARTRANHPGERRRAHQKRGAVGCRRPRY